MSAPFVVVLPLRLRAQRRAQALRRAALREQDRLDNEALRRYEARMRRNGAAH